MDAPLITIFVRHSATCKYAGDEFNKRCDCKKHLRWTLNGAQHRRKTGQRSWAGAEGVKRDLEAQLTGRAPVQQDAEQFLAQAIHTFQDSKAAQGLESPVLGAYKLVLKRLQTFNEGRGVFTVRQALTLENLIAFRNSWSKLYASSYSRQQTQKRLNHFLRFARGAQWIDWIPTLSPIHVDEPETSPLTDEEYNKVLATATGKTLTVIKLMRWSGLAIRDASTLKRGDLNFDKGSGIYRIIRKRTKTGEDLYIPIPKDVAEEVTAVLNGNPVYVFWQKWRKGELEDGYARWMGMEISRAFKAAGVTAEGHMVSHRLRATFAVDLLTKGLPLEHVSKLLGHRSVTTTERHYAKWVKGRQDRLDALVSATWAK
jgi:integrase/recombinase XerD